MPQSDPATAVERYTAIIFGGLLLLLAASLCGWGVRLAVAALHTPAGWPPGLGQLLLPVGITVLVVGFGAWRLLRIGLPARVAGRALGRSVLACFALAAIIGAVA